MAGLEEKKSGLISKPPVSMATSTAQNEAVMTAIATLSGADVVRRIWQNDYTVWKPDPAEITDRLGWLTVTDFMHEHLPLMQRFTQAVCHAGFRHVVLLGMGGSSLGAEVLRQVFGSSPGYPELMVLDSTVPAAIQAVTGVIEPAHTLFIVSSKSGTTTEPMILFRYFKNLVTKVKGRDTGQNFIAITDGRTPLARMAEEERFRDVFLNPSDIGGRYSALSFFGLIPAALTGINVSFLLDRADAMRGACAASVPDEHNPGVWLGARLGAFARDGRDKMTLVTSPSLRGFGLWVEQLIAESTGKEGKGIIPVAGEPLLSPENYGNDRLFVYLRLKDDNNSATDTAVNAIKDSGQPVLALEMNDKFDLGAEFFRWEFATAVAGALLGVHPFNQPDVQRAKEATERLLREYTQSRNLPGIESTGQLSDLLANTTPGKYFAIMAYLHETPTTDEIFTALRHQVVERYHIATTLGYGPRFLHSTGQLHKGGPDSGLFLQITTAHENDPPVPGEPYTFGIVADAQALGDLQALQVTGRRVVTLRVQPEDVSSLRELLNDVNRP